jgi:anti-anti-sigma factor
VLSIELAGEWDLSRGDELRRYIKSTVGHPRVIFDLSDVTYIDSNCVAMLIRMSALRMAQAYPPVRFVISNANVLRIVSIVGAERPLSIFEKLDDALSDWQRFGNNSAVRTT